MEGNGRGAIRGDQVQRCINAQGVRRGNRREEVILTRLRFDHAGLNKTRNMYVIKISHCKTRENVEHTLTGCNKCKDKRLHLRTRKTGRDWNPEGILGTPGERVMYAKKAVIELKRYTVM